MEIELDVLLSIVTVCCRFDPDIFSKYYLSETGFHIVSRAVTRALIGGGGLYIFAFFDFKRNSSGRTQIYEYTPSPINALVTALIVSNPFLTSIFMRLTQRWPSIGFINRTICLRIVHLLSCLMFAIPAIVHTFLLVSNGLFTLVV